MLLLEQRWAEFAQRGVDIMNNKSALLLEQGWAPYGINNFKQGELLLEWWWALYGVNVTTNQPVLCILLSRWPA